MVLPIERPPGEGAITVVERFGLGEPGAAPLVPLEPGGSFITGGFLEGSGPRLSDFGTGAVGPLGQPLFGDGAILPSVTGEPLGNVHTDWTVPLTRGALDMILGVGATAVMPRVMLESLVQACLPERPAAGAGEATAVIRSDVLQFVLRQAQGDRTIIADYPDLASERALAFATGGEPTNVTEVIPMAARMGTAARVRFNIVASPSFAEISESLVTANRLITQTHVGTRGDWHRSLETALEANTNNPDLYPPEFKQLLYRTFIATDPRFPGDMSETSNEILAANVALNDPNLSAERRPILEDNLAQGLARLQEQVSTVQRFQSYLAARGGMERSMDRAFVDISLPFSQDLVRGQVDLRVRSYMTEHPAMTYEQVANAVGGGPVPPSIFPSRVRDVEFVHPPVGTDLADAGSSAGYGIKLQVEGRGDEFLNFLERRIQNGQPDVQLGQLFTREHTQEIEAVMHLPGEPAQTVRLQATVAEDDIHPLPDSSARAWESMTARRDPADPNRILVTSTIEMRLPDGRIENRETRFFVEVRGR